MNRVQDARNRSVTITTESNRCTGLIIATDLILTCFHILENDSKVFVNGKEARIAVCAPEYDLIILATKTQELEAVEFAEPVMDGKAFYVGNPGEHVGVCVQGYVVDMNSSLVFFDGRVRRGASGSGLYQKDGLIGIVTSLELSDKVATFGVALRSCVIQQFLKEVLFR